MLFIQIISLTGHKTYMLPTALGLLEDMSHRSVLALDVQSFS